MKRMGSRKLAKYRAKRDFTKTAEPSGAVGVAAAEYLRIMDTSSKIDMLHPATIEYAFRIPNSVTDPDHEF